MNLDKTPFVPDLQTDFVEKIHNLFILTYLVGITLPIEIDIL